MKNITFLLFLLLAFIIIDLNQIIDLIFPKKRKNYIDIELDIEGFQSEKQEDDSIIKPLQLLDYDITDKMRKIRFKIKSIGNEKNMKKFYRVNMDDLAVQFPDVVKTKKNGKKVINYKRLFDYLIKGIQETQFLIKTNNEDNIKLMEHVGKVQNELKGIKLMVNNY